MYEQLPDFVNIDYKSFSEERSENIIQDEFETGYVQQRRRYSRTRKKIAFNVWFKLKDKNEFEKWFDENINFGLRPFYIYYGPERKETLIRLQNNSLNFDFQDEYVVLEMKAEIYI